MRLRLTETSRHGKSEDARRGFRIAHCVRGYAHLLFPAKVALTIFLLVILSLNAFAFTISPAKLVFDTPGIHEFTVTIHNTGHEEGLLRIRAEGDLRQDISFNSQSYNLTANDGDVTFTGSINIPADIIPGDHGQQLIVGFDKQGINTEIATLLIARRRYDGPYLVADLYSTPDAGIQDTTQVTFTLQNIGNTPVTPTYILLQTYKQTAIETKEIPAGASAQFTATLHGRGEYPLQLIVAGKAPLEQNYTIVLGHPLITTLSATRVPETGPIKPVIVDATISWNKPVQAQLIVDNKSYPVTIDRTLHDTYYAETNATSIPVTLIVGAEQRNAEARPEIAPAMAAFDWTIIVACAIIILGIGIWSYWRA